MINWVIELNYTKDNPVYKVKYYVKDGVLYEGTP